MQRGMPAARSRGQVLESAVLTNHSLSAVGVGRRQEEAMTHERVGCVHTFK